MSDYEARLSDCLRMLEETGDAERCVVACPELEAEIRSLSATSRTLAVSAPPANSAVGQSLSRQRSLSALAQPTTSSSPWAPLRGLAGGLAALTILLVGMTGAAAAKTGGMGGLGPVSEVLSAVGLAEDKDPQDAGSSPDAVEPEGLQQEPDPSPVAAPLQTADPAELAEEGRGVSEEVHEAIDGGEPGPERGIAVSETACGTAHDPNRLPEKAAEARANQDKDPKDCTHPNADGTPGAGNGNKPDKSQQQGKPDTVPGGPQSGGPPGGGPPGKNKP